MWTKKQIAILVTLLVVLNLLDCVYTQYWIQQFGVEEGNPLLATLAHHRPVLFYLVKMSMVGVFGGFLILFRERKSAQWGLLISTGFYSLIVGYHTAAYLSVNTTGSFSLVAALI